MTIQVNEDSGLVKVGKGLDDLCINTIRVLSIDAVQKANSGHPGLPHGSGGNGLCSLDALPQVQPP